MKRSWLYSIISIFILLCAWGVAFVYVSNGNLNATKHSNTPVSISAADSVEITISERLKKTAVSGLAFAPDIVTQGFPTPGSTETTAWFEILGSLQVDGSVYVTRDIGSGIVFTVDITYLHPQNGQSFGLMTSDLISSRNDGKNSIVRFYWHDTPDWIEAKKNIESGKLVPDKTSRRSILRY